MIRWDFTKKAGTLTQMNGSREWTFNFYTGNAMMIVLYEYVEDDTEKYQMQWFFSDERHAKACLGFEKRADGEKRNIFQDEPVTSITIYREHCREWLKIADLFSKAFPEITLNILPSEPKAE